MSELYCAERTNVSSLPESGLPQAGKCAGKKVLRTGNFVLNQLTIDILKKGQGKLKQFDTADLVPLKAGRNTWTGITVISNDVFFFLMKKENLILKTYLVLINGRKGRL